MIFDHLSLNTFVTLFQDEPKANPILSILFERLCRDLTDGTLKVFDDLFALLGAFYQQDKSKQKILLDIAVMVMVGLAKDKRQKSHLERFRDRVSEIIRKEVDDGESLDTLIRSTLPAFVIIVKSHIFNSKATEADAAGDKNNDIPELIKTFLKHTVIVSLFFLSFISQFSSQYKSKGINGNIPLYVEGQIQ